MKQPPTDTKLRLRNVSDAPKRVKSIIRGIFESLGIKQPTQLHCVLAARAAELTIVSEELSNRLLAGETINVEVIGRNADRLQRTLSELNRHAPIQVTHLSTDDEDEEPRKFGRYI